MIKLKKPNIDISLLIDSCINDMNLSGRKTRITQSKDIIIRKSIAYDTLASSEELYTIQPNHMTNVATKDDMVFLYNQKLVPKTQCRRKIYDEIMLSAPNSRCPYCGQRNVSTLDHYLSKTKYPTYAVTPTNLIPSCKDCNSDKGNTPMLAKKDQTIHPYYDDFTTESWLSANLIEEIPVTFDFYVVKPSNWDNSKYIKAVQHFNTYHLNNVYLPHAAEEFIGLESRLKKLYATGGIDLSIEHLRECINEKNQIRLNTWQAAMYQAIIDSTWFWQNFC